MKDKLILFRANESLLNEIKELIDERLVNHFKIMLDTDIEDCDIGIMKENNDNLIVIKSMLLND